MSATLCSNNFLSPVPWGQPYAFNFFKLSHLPILGDPGATSRDDAVFLGESLLQELRSPWELILKAVTNEDTLLRTHCCRHNCFPVCSRAQHLLRTQILCLCSETFCVCNKCFPACAAQETSWATMCPQQCVLVWARSGRKGDSH